MEESNKSSRLSSPALEIQKNVATKTPLMPCSTSPGPSFKRAYVITSKSAAVQGINSPLAEHYKFEVPPEAPVFRPTAKEFRDPLAYINQIRPIAEDAGICKIIPPKGWEPPFALDANKLRFTPRIQKLNQLEALNRVKLNFLDEISKYWKLQGSVLKIPMVEGKPLDLYTLYRLVQGDGGAVVVTKEKKWASISLQMGFQHCTIFGLIKHHYENILYPYDTFIEKKAEELARLNFQAFTSQLDKICESQTKKMEMSRALPISKAPQTPVQSTEGNIIQQPLLSVQKCDTGQEIKLQTTVLTNTEKDVKATNESKLPISNELKSIQTYTLKPKFVGFSSKKKRRYKRFTKDYDLLAKYICRNCARGDHEEDMLLCAGCDDNYHTFCLIPPLPVVPEGEWRCLNCVAVEVSKPKEAFGFEQAQREYNLHEFGEMADQFKSEYFGVPVHLVPTTIVEKEFWRMVSSFEEDVIVEYGADLHTVDHGSGFPTNNTINFHPGSEEYVWCNWNLNNLPVMEDSVFSYIHADISGMKVPWMYVGMCFSAFCWHNEDHWSYSINYLHWGEPKTWYGVPGKKAVKFEETMKAVAPELFQSQPDLLHQLVTIMNPNILMSASIPVFRTDQNAGEFVVTFPRAYHAGFNQGYNFAEAVNFATADWIPIGRECIAQYSLLRRLCVFSHDELVCRMALEAKRLNPILADATYKDMVNMITTERDFRKQILDWGVSNFEKEMFELLPDDARQCNICKTTCFLSAVTCPCNKDTLACVRHYKQLCKCPPAKYILRYRYTLDELPDTLKGLKNRTELYDTWLTNVEKALNPENENLLTLAQLKSLVTEAEENRYPSCDLMAALITEVNDAEKIVSIICKLEVEITLRRTRCSFNDTRNYLNLEELQQFIEEIGNLRCSIDGINIVKDLLAESCQFENSANLLLMTPLNTVNVDDIAECVAHGKTIRSALPSLNALRIRLSHAKWLADVAAMLMKPEVLSLSAVTDLIRRGEALPTEVFIVSQLTELHNLVTMNENWETRAALFLSSPKTCNSVLEIQELLADAENMKIYLPTEFKLCTILHSIKEWRGSFKAIDDLQYYPYLNAVQTLCAKALTIEIPLPEVCELEKNIKDGCIWLDKTRNIFLEVTSILSLMDALCPRTSHTLIAALKCRTVSTEDDPNAFKISDDMCPATVIEYFKQAKQRELEGLRSLRVANMAKSLDIEDGYKFCICQQGVFGVMMQCELCKDWFHSTCVNLPRIANYKVRKNFTAVALKLEFMDCKFICIICQRSKRPRLETILNSLQSLENLCVRIPEGEVLQCLTEHALMWQEHVKSLLRSEELVQANTKLNLLLQRIHGTMQSQTEKLDTSEGASCSNNEAQSLFYVKSGDISSEDSNSSQGIKSTVVYPSTVGEDTLDEHAYSLQFPTFNSTDSVLHLSDETRLQLEDTLLEGDLLEINLDETYQLWKFLQASRNPERDVILKDFSQAAEVQQKIQRKCRFDKADTPGTSKLTKDSNKRSLKSKPTRIIPKRNRRKRRIIQSSSSSDDDNKEFCACDNCVDPKEAKVHWVQCDGGCNKWFHMKCVGLSAEEISEDEDYICLACSRKSSAFGNLKPLSPECESDCSGSSV